MSASPDAAGFAATLQLAAALAALLCLVAAAIEDGWRYRISNALVIGVVLCFAVFAAAQGSWVLLGWSLAAGVGVLLVAMLPFALGIFGGGDTKLIAAMALWTQFAGLPRFLLVMSACGGILGVVWLIRRRLAGPKVSAAAAQEPPARPAPAGTPASGDAAREEPDSGPGEAAPFARLPYGIAIALAGIDFFLFGPQSPLLGWLPF
ncbi:MAG TPA: prepilin peptidase [Alphaproteobacteria bacterium]|nr:prepilin peptidase [Alphaproteobacteria bacterium]